MAKQIFGVNQRIVVNTTIYVSAESEDQAEDLAADHVTTAIQGALCEPELDTAVVTEIEATDVYETDLPV
jgi:hypothetical protein